MTNEEIKGWALAYGVTVDFEGQTEGGKPNGWGQAKYLDGKRYEGEWKDGKMHGKGKEFYPGGVLEYEGEYKDGLRDGFGKAYLHDGRLVYEGKWEKGEQIEGSSTTTNWA